jgi:hypothetical protein
VLNWDAVGRFLAVFDWDACWPFLVIAAAFPVSGELVRAVAAPSATNPVVLRGAQATPLADFLDWAVDATQIAPIVAIPIITLSFERSREPWALPTMAGAGILLLLAALRVLRADPERYAQRKRGHLTRLAWVGIAFNLIVGLILGFGWLRDADYVPAATDTIGSVTVDHQPGAAPNTFVVDLTIHGGVEALAGRIPWVANAGHQPDATLGGSTDLFWTAAPCMPSPDGVHKCRNVYLSLDGDCDFEGDIFPALVDAKGVYGMMTGWKDHPDGHFAAPDGVNGPQPTKYTRTDTGPQCEDSSK